MTTNTFINNIAVPSSTEIRVYADYRDAHPISGVYIFEVERGLVKCGTSKNVKKRLLQLEDIKKHREVPLEGRFAVLPVDREKLKNVETAFFSLLGKNVEGTELFKMSFDRALKALHKLYESNPPSMFHLTGEEKAEKERKALMSEKAIKNALGLDASLIRQKYSNERVINEISISKVFTELLEAFPKSVDRLSLERIRNEYRHYLELVSIVIAPKVWEEGFGKLRLDEITAGRMGALSLRLHHVVFSYKDVLKSSAHPRQIVYHAANLVAVLEDIRNLYGELIEVDENYEGKYPSWLLTQLKEARDASGHFIRYLLARFVVTCSYPEQDVSHFRENLHSMGKRLHEMYKEEERG